MNAIDDLFTIGFVRNAESAGVREKSRWGERVFWSRGSEGKCHAVSVDTYVLEASHTKALTGRVKSEDVNAIYTRTESGEITNILPEYLAKKYSI